MFWLGHRSSLRFPVFVRSFRDVKVMRSGWTCCGQILAPQSLRSMSYFTILIDRKSTRLNSSHLVISYAVFCLKKKKKKIQKSHAIEKQYKISLSSTIHV